MSAISSETWIGMFRRMALIRAFEAKAHELFAAGRIPGFVHLYAGEEAVAVGVCSHLTKDDFITSTHRGHGHCIAKGCDPRYMMAELLGKATGYCRGKGGSMHIADVGMGMLGANGIVGAGGPLATGAALAAKVRGTRNVAVCFFGDGAANQGTILESMNLSSIWKLPVIFVAEDNQYAISLRSQGPSEGQPRWSTARDLTHRASGFGLPAIAVDGNDITAVYEAAGETIKRAREGEGPSFLHCLTYRHYGHFEGDLGAYRSRVEEEEWRKRDPIPRLRAKLVEMGVLTEAKAEEIRKICQKQVEEAVEFAEKSPWPDPADAFTDVFVSPYY